MRLIMRAVLILSAGLFASAASAQLTVGGGGATPSTPSTTPSTSAPSGLITQYNPDQIAQILTAAGFQSKSTVTSDNKTHFVSTQFWPNTTSGVLGIGCDSDGSNCVSYEIFTMLPNEQSIGDAWTDAWNNAFWFVKAVKSGDNLIFQMDVMLDPGVTPAYIGASAQVFKEIVGQAATFNPNKQQ
jgi:hypothetical protein